MGHHNGQRDPAKRQGPKPVTTKQGSSNKSTSRKKATIPVAKKIPERLRRVQKKKTEKITYVLDTNVIISAWDSLFKFEEHEVCLVSQVWKELDKHKKGHSAEAWNTRKAIRTIDALLAGKTSEEIQKGVPLTPPAELLNGRIHTGVLTLDFTKPKIPEKLDIDLSLNEPDERIIMICLSLKDEGKRVVLISNDANCRVKASLAGIEAEEYLSEAASEAVISEEDNVKGFHHMPEDIWDKQSKDVITDTQGCITTYKLTHPIFKEVNCNEFLVFQDGKIFIVLDKPEPITVIAQTLDPKIKISGTTPKNLEQGMAAYLLMSEEISAVSLAGLSGSGKTYITLCAAMCQTFDMKRYNKIIITRSTIGSDEDIGFLPGTEEEKMSPWMGAMYDNLEVITGSSEHHETGENISQDDQADITRSMLRSKIQIKSMNFMKGRTINNTFIIVDETQDLTAKKLKMIATRVGPGSKIVFLGNAAQIDDNYLTEHTCGLSVFIRAFANSKLSGHITLQQGERSPFATEADGRL